MGANRRIPSYSEELPRGIAVSSMSAACQSVASSTHHRYPPRRPRARLALDDDLHVLIERRQKRHQPPQRESIELIVCQRRDFRPVDAELLPPRRKSDGGGRLRC